MKSELKIIELAVFQKNDYLLTPHAIQHAISQGIWENWSPIIQQEAFQTFLQGKPPFLSVFDVSADGTSVFLKGLSRVASKPGFRSKMRTHSEDSIIKKSLRQHIEFANYIVYIVI